MTVAEGQTVRDLARKYLDDPDLWAEILKANGLGSPADVKPGMKLRIPSAAVFKASRQLASSQEAIEKATQAGAKVLATEAINEAIRLRDQALLQQKTGNWAGSLELARKAEDQAREALSASLARKNVAAEAVVQEETGTVQSRKPSASAWNDAPVGTLLAEGDRLRTGAASSAEVRMPNGSRLRLNENAQAVMQKLRLDVLEQREESNVSLVEGDALALLEGSGARRKFNLELANTKTRVDVKSNNFWVSRGKGQTRFANYEGELELSSEHGKVVLKPNQGAVVDKSNRISAAKPLLPAPALASPAPGTLYYRNRVQLAWKPVKGAVRYQLEVASDKGFNRVHLRRMDLVETTLPTTLLQDGEYFWRVAALDSDGLRGPTAEPGSFRVTVDEQPPFLAVHEPGEGATVRDSPVMVVGEVEEGATLTVAGQPVKPGEGGRFQLPLPLSPGVNELAIQAVDAAGNVTPLKRKVTFVPRVDLKLGYSPTLPRSGEKHFLSPGRGFTLAGTTAPGVAVAVLSPAKVTLCRTHAGRDGGFELNLPLTQDPGPEEFLLQVRAESGESLDDRFIVETITRPPELSLESEPPALVNRKALKLAGRAVGAVRLALDGREVPRTGESFELTVDLKPGDNTLRLTARDALGNSSVLERTVRLDQEPPELLGHSVSPRVASEGQQISIQVKAADDSGLKKASRFGVQVGKSFYTGVLRLQRATATYEGTLVVPSGGSGEVSLRSVELSDYAGNRREYRFGGAP